MRVTTLATREVHAFALQPDAKTSEQNRTAWLFRLLFALLALSSMLISNNAFAQPTAMSINQDVSGTYANTAMSLQGGAFRARFQENGSGTSSGTRNWQFNADSYFNTWGVLSTNGSSSVTLSGYNSVIVSNGATASANWEGGPGYNSKGRLPATQANYYYTYNVMKGSSYASQRMSVLETSFNPVSLNTVAQSMGVYGGRLVTITTSGTPNASENIFVRYSTNGFSTSTIIQATGSGSTWSATIPWQTSAVTFYVYSSNRTKAAIDADVTSLSTQEVHDLSTLNLNNNSGSNYTYTPLTGNIIVSATGGSTSGTYSTITGASGLFAALNAGTHTGTVTALITADLTETGANSLNNLAALTSLGIQPLGARTVSGAITAGSPMINFNGGDNVTIDGLNAGGNSLTISNTTNSATTGTCTIKFISDATNNTITNCTILGSPSMAVGTNGGVIFFSTGTTTGNDNNTISNCTIGSAGANLASKGIYGNGSTTSTAVGNSGITITNNNFPDIFGAAVTSAGIYCADGCNTWSVTNNRFYQTGARSWTTGAQHSPIWITGTSTTSGAQAFTITGNIIGYASSSQTGTYVLGGSGSGARFNAIYFNGMTPATTTTISNNTIASISMTGVTSSGTGTSSCFAAMMLVEGTFVTNGNTIGSQSATGSVNFATNTATSTEVYGIYNFSSNTWTSNNNNIGGFNVANTGSGSMVFYLLRANTATTTTWTATGNNVGGTVANSIALNAASTSSQVVGMYTSNAPMTFTSNTVRNMVTNIGTGATTSASMIGIISTSTSSNNNISQCSIYNLSNTNASAASVVTGMQFSGSSANTVTRNNIYGLTVSTNSASAEVNGIRVAAGTTTFANNMIALGAGINNAVPINGINEPSLSGTDNFYHNSVYIGGSPTAGSGNSFAFNSLVTTNTRAFRDNIFMNARSNSGATGKNYAVQVGGTAANPTGLTVNNNIYYVTGTGGVFGRFNSADVADLTAWKTAVGQDLASISADPAFNDPTNATTPDLHIHPTNVSAAEGAGANVGITDDFDGQTRSGLTPVDIGADAGNFTGAPPMTYVSSTAVQQTGSFCPGTANIPVLRMEVVTANAVSPLTLTSLTLNGTGTSNLADVASYRVYYTGTSSTFSTSNPIIAAASPLSNSSIVITPSSTVTLSQGTNYFWLTYTLASSVTGPDLDAQFTSVALSTGGGTPTVTNPSGVVTANPLPAAVTVSGGGTFCTSAIISASNGNDGTMYYQGTTSGGTSIGTPSSSQTITTSGTYYFRALSAAGCWGPEGSATVAIQTPASITTTPASICIGGSGTVAATSATGCVSFVNSGTAIPGAWVAATDPVAKRITSSITNTSTCSFDASITRNYVAKQFQVSVTGNYVFEMDDNSGYDGMGYIVSGSFVPGTCPGTGTWIRGDDDDGVAGNEPRLGASGSGSGVMTLTAGVTYTLISTTYSLSSGTISGSFNWTITPPSGGQIMLPASGAIQWYTAASGGSSIGTGSPFNPVGVAGSPLANTNTAGTTVFYAACSNSSACRTPVNFVINPNTSITLSSNPGTDNQTVCINSALTTIAYAIGNGGTGASITAGTLPTGLNGSYNAGTFSIGGTPTQSGTFNVTISTSGGCGVATANVTIVVNPANTITLSSILGTDAQTVCATASITPITYTVTGATGASASGLPTGVNGVYNAGVFTISGTPTATSGTYNYTVTTTGGCGVATASGSITINGALGGSYVKTNLTACNVTPDGTITVTATGGSGAYTYSWTGVTGSGNPASTPFSAGNVSSLTGLNYGYYNVTITDNGGCGSVTLSNIHVEFAYSVYVTNSGTSSSSCGNTGSIILYGNAGVTPYTYSLNGTTYQVSNTFTGLAAGSYTAYVKDAGGCVSTKSITVGSIAPITVSPFTRSASSCANDGSIEVYRSGGTPPYTYSKDGTNYQSSNVFSGMAAGTYTVYVKDAQGCIGSASAIVAQGAALTVTANKSNTSTCVTDGSIQVNVTGGIAPFTYSKDNGATYQSGNTFNGLGAGNYVIVVKDSKNCTGTLNVTINLNPITVTSSVVNASDCSSSNGKITLFRAGGVGPYTYSIDGNTYQSSSVFTNLAPGTYDGYVKDSKTCIGVMSGIVVGPGCPPPPVAGGATKSSVQSLVRIRTVTPKVTAYPNPSSSEFMLSLEGYGTDRVSIVVMDAMGRVVYEESGEVKQQYRFGSKLRAGVYMVQVSDGTSRQQIKVVKE